MPVEWWTEEEQEALLERIGTVIETSARGDRWPAADSERLARRELV